MNEASGLHREQRVAMPDGAPLYVERRGVGRRVLLIHAGSEDCSGWRAQADAIAERGFAVVSYDRRGTGRSGRQGWPADGAPAHARDAASLVTALGFERPVVLGVSSGAIVALQLAITAPDLIGTVFAHEPPTFRHATGGAAEYERLDTIVRDALAREPGRYADAYAMLMETAHRPGTVAGMSAQRWAMESTNSETFLRDDLPLIARHRFVETDLRQSQADVRLSSGTESPPFLIKATSTMAALGGWPHRRLVGQGHTPHLSEPDVFAELIAAASNG